MRSLEVEQHLLAVRIAEPEGRELAHRVLVVPLQAFHTNRADVKERAAVDLQSEVDAVLGRFDMRLGGAPRGGGVTIRAQPRQRARLRVRPARLSEGLADRQRPLRAQAIQLTAFRQAICLKLECADHRARAGLDDQAHQRQAGVLGRRRHGDDRVEVALSLQQFARLCGRRTHQAIEFGSADAFGGRNVLKARQIEIVGQQRAQRIGRLDLQAIFGVQRHRRVRTGVGPGLHERQAGAACQQAHRERGAGPAQPGHLLSKRMAPSSPASVSGNMRWFINCWTTAMLCR